MESAAEQHSGSSGSTAKRSIREIVQITRAIVTARVQLRRCTHVGPRARVVGRVVVHNSGSITIGERVLIHSTVVPVELASVDGGTLEIGARTFLNYGVSISAHQLVHIGDDCLLGNYVNIMDNSWHDIHVRWQKPPSRPVILENNVWLANHVIVLPGVTIGHDSVVGAGSVVVKDIPPRSIAVGNPARVVKTF